MIDELIQKSKSFSKLLEDYKQALEIQKHDYCVRHYKDDLYELIDVKSNSLIRLDKESVINRWLRLRRITSIIKI